MNISKIHKRFSELLKNPRVLTYPQEFLGPNFEAVLNFWLILDELSEEQLKTIKGCYRDFYYNQESECCKAANKAYEASNETIGTEFVNNATFTAWEVYDSSVSWTSREIIGMHLILDQQKPLTFFQMFLEVL